VCRAAAASLRGNQLVPSRRSRERASGKFEDTPAVSAAMWNSFSKAANDAAAAVAKGANTAAISAEKQVHEANITQIKNKWGREAFEFALRGDMAAVAAMAHKSNEEIVKVQTKIAALDVKLAALKAPTTQKCAVVVPHGATAGSSFIAATPGGTQFSVTVPQGAAPGTQIIVDAPLDAPVVVGQPVGGAAPPPPPPPP